MSKNLKDFIFYKNIFCKDLAKDIILEFGDSNFDRSSHHNKETRHLGSIEISKTEIINKVNSYERATILEKIKIEVQKIVDEYLKFLNVDSLPIDQSSHFSLREMNEGDWYGEHDDDGVGNATGDYKFTISICLNDDYKGGDFGFFNNKKKYKLKTGDVLMFPSNFMFPHCVNKITKGTRYQLLLWIK
jgi:predicted 2-oxoglutarate/Fe(II)-dependent dioxygenase YbiX